MVQALLQLPRSGTTRGKGRPASWARTLAVVASLLVLLPAAYAQVSTASLSLLVVGADDDVLPGVAVEILNADTGLVRSAVTDASGKVMIPALPPGPYKITTSLEGMTDPAATVVTLHVGERGQLRLELRPLTAEAITVTGKRPLVDLYRIDSSTNIVPEQIEALPVPDRQYERLALLTPGTQRDRAEFFNRYGAPVVGSSGGSAFTAYLMDGADFTDPFFGLARVRVSQDAIEEFRVIAQRSDAEIGGSAGGAISVVTKSGTNTLKASTWGFYRVDSLRAESELELGEADFARYHFGLTAGGPIRRDRTHFFASAEHVDQQDVAFFRPGGDFADLAADVPVPFEQNLALLSIDHQLTASSSGMAKLIYENSRLANYQVGGVRDRSTGWDVERDHGNLLIGQTWVLTPRRLNELRGQVGFSDSDWPKNSERMAEYFSLGATLITGRDWVGENRDDARYVELRDTLHLQAGPRHHLKAGASYQYISRSYLQETFDAGQMDYFTDDRSLPWLYYYGVGSSRVDQQSDLVGAFVQDDWRPRDNLTLSLGLRYDVDIGGNNPDFTHSLLPSNRGTDWNNLQPRFGFSFDVTGDGANILRGGAGIFSGRYLALPALNELGWNDETGRSTLFRINGLLAGFEPPFDRWLSPADPLNTGTPLPPNITLLGEELSNPQATQLTLGYSRRLGSSGLFLDLEGIYVEGDKEPVFHNGNWEGNDAPDQISRIHPQYTWIFSTVDSGHSRYEALLTRVHGTLRGGHLISGSLTLADKKNLMDDPQTLLFPSDSGDLDAEWGRSLSDERYRLVLSGVFRLPWGFILAPFYEYGSGQPWNQLLGYDYNDDLAVTDRPPGVARNSQDGPPFRQLSLRLAKTFPLGSSDSVELILESFNVFNTTNYVVDSVQNGMFSPLDPTGTVIPNPRFGEFTQTHRPREIQLGARYRF